MATLEEQRRAIGDAMEKSRRAIGDRMEKSRRAAGDAMVARRTGRSVQADVNALVNRPRQRPTLPPVQSRGGLPAQVGVGSYGGNPSGGGKGGIASPLTEVANSREYSLDETWVEAIDGSGLVRVRVAKKLRLTDADGAEVIINLDA